MVRLLDRANQRPGAVLLRALLMPAGWGYGLITGARNWLFDKKICAAYNPRVLTISVGNITAGGTGKTPIVIWLVNKLAAAGQKPAVLTRGYKSKGGAISDEPAIIERACAGVKVLINSNRIASARRAVYELARDVLVLDDGFQHRRLARDVDILAIDATRPFGYGRMIPAGLLRESVNSIRRAHAVIITRCDLVEKDELDVIIDKIEETNPKAVIATSRHKLGEVRFGDGSAAGIGEMAGKKIFAFCGIGNPEAFFGQLQKCGLEVVGRRVFADHHNYSQGELDAVLAEAELAGAQAAITTQKDYLKLERLEAGGKVKLGFAGVRLEFIEGEDRILKLIIDD